jgi:hypothetical protein
MSCNEIEHKLPAYLEDALSPQEKGLVEEHLASCPQCKKAIEDLKRTEKLVREMEEVEPPPWFTQRIMSRVREEAKQETGIFRKLFYPLHIKIPVQALATVLIAVLALQIYRVGEPEMKGFVAPPAAVFEAGKDQAPASAQKPPEVAPAPAAKEKTVLTKVPKKDMDMAASAPGSGDGKIRKEKYIIREGGEFPADKSIVAQKKRESVQDKTEEAMKPALSSVRQEPPKAIPAPALEYKRAEIGHYAGAAKESRKYEALPAAPQAIGTAVRKPAHIGVTVHVEDAGVAVKEVKNLLGKFGARKIERQSLEGKEVITAELKVQNVKEFMEKLKTIGEMGEKGMPSDIRERDISITIEIFGK